MGFAITWHVHTPLALFQSQGIGHWTIPSDSLALQGKRSPIRAGSYRQLLHIPYIHTYIPLHYLTLHYLTLPYLTFPYIPYIHTYIHTYITLHYITIQYNTLQYNTNIPTYQHTNIPTYQHTNIIPPPQATGGGGGPEEPYHHHRPQGGGPEEPYHHHRPQEGGPEEPYHHHRPQGGGDQKNQTILSTHTHWWGGGGGVANAAPYIFSQKRSGPLNFIFNTCISASSSHLF